MESSAKLVLENAEVCDIDESRFGWRVKAIIERQNRQGETLTAWYTLWMKEPPKFEVGWFITVSGYLKVKAYADSRGTPRVSVEMNSPVITDMVPPADEDLWDPEERFG